MPPDQGGPQAHAPPPSPEDRQRVEHMLKCSRDARVIVADDDAAAIALDMVRTRALVNCFTEIGEAAARLTAPARVLVGAVPWRQIVGMRNIVVHVYWGIDLGELVKTARHDLPVLITALKKRDRDLAAGPAAQRPTARSRAGVSTGPPSRQSIHVSARNAPTADTVRR